MPDDGRTIARARVYFNGEIIPAGDARLPIDDQGVLFGLGFFETFRTSGGRPHHWKYNRRRLEPACATAGIAVPATFLAADESRLRDVVRQLLDGSEHGDAVFRYTITAGAEEPVRIGAPEPKRVGEKLHAGRAYSRTPSEFLTMRPLPPPAETKGICLRLLNLARDNGEWLPRPKSLNYANALMGAEELRRRKAQVNDEGLFLSRDGGCVVETVRQNIGWIKNDRIHYPDLALGPVAGTCFAWLLELGFASEPCRARVDDLLEADAVFVANSVRGITSVHELWDKDDATLLGSFSSAAHPLIGALRERWSDALRVTAAA